MERVTELTYEVNVEWAVDPQAIVMSPPKKLPIDDNDPMRNVTKRERFDRVALVALSLLALLVLLVATALALARA